MCTSYKEPLPLHVPIIPSFILLPHTKHKSEIRKNPLFRRDFQIMCAQIGVDPLASQKGHHSLLTERSPFTPHRKVTIPPNPLLFTPYLGFWSELLGMGDFYYALGIQIIETCFATVFFMTETHLGCTETPCGLYPDPNSNPNYTPYPNPVLVALLSYFSWMLLLSTAQQKWRINGTRDIVE